jgi:hypothetical protein
MSSGGMGKIVYHEFLGSRLLLTILGVSVIGIPLAVIYLLENTVTVEESLEFPSEFLDKKREQLRRARWGGRTT